MHFQTYNVSFSQAPLLGFKKILSCFTKCHPCDHTQSCLVKIANLIAQSLLSSFVKDLEEGWVDDFINQKMV
jgi:hypothetical protein